LRLKVLRDFIK